MHSSQFSWVKPIARLIFKVQNFLEHMIFHRSLLLSTYIYIYTIYTLYNYNMGKRNLPDIYAQARGRGHMSGKSRVPML